MGFSRSRGCCCRHRACAGCPHTSSSAAARSRHHAVAASVSAAAGAAAAVTSEGPASAPLCGRLSCAACAAMWSPLTRDTSPARIPVPPCTPPAVSTDRCARASCFCSCSTCSSWEGNSFVNQSDRHTRMQWEYAQAAQIGLRASASTQRKAALPAPISSAFSSSAIAATTCLACALVQLQL